MVTLFPIEILSEYNVFCWLGYTVATTVNVNLPPAAQTNSTVLRWRKISKNSIDMDEWAILHAYAGDQVPVGIIFSENFDTVPIIG